MPKTKERQVIVKLLKPFRNLNRGEKANFAESLAAELVKKGIAEKVGLEPRDPKTIPPETWPGGLGQG